MTHKDKLKYANAACARFAISTCGNISRQSSQINENIWHIVAHYDIPKTVIELLTSIAKIHTREILMVVRRLVECFRVPSGFRMPM